MADHSQDTVHFRLTPEDSNQTRAILGEVFGALQEKGYNPINQIVGYLISGDPAYITSHKNARSRIRKLERDDILEELVGFYLQEVK